MTNELTRPLTGAEERLWQEKLAALLVRQIALYTANESSSVPAAAARELLRGVLFFLAVPEEADGGGEADRAARIRTLLSCDLADELARGQRRAQRDAALTIALWRKVVETLPPLENRSLRDTLRSIGRGFRCYDTRFFPQRFDCDIDYQLSQSVSESLLGINYVNQYLARLAAENSLESVAFCCISTGEFHFPNEQAAQIAVETVKQFMNRNTGVKKVIFNVFKDLDKAIYEKLLRAD